MLVAGEGLGLDILREFDQWSSTLTWRLYKLAAQTSICPKCALKGFPKTIIPLIAIV